MSLRRSSSLIISRSLTGLTSPSTWVTSMSSNVPDQIKQFFELVSACNKNCKLTQ